VLALVVLLAIWGREAVMIETERMQTLLHMLFP
jgi:hypothetical protein